MAKGVSDELEKLSEKILRDVINTPPGVDYPMPQNATGQAPEIKAIEYLLIEGALVQGTVPLPGLGGGEEVIPIAMVTRRGREYFEELSTPTPVYWLRRNWFPALIAATTLAVSITGIVRG